MKFLAAAVQMLASDDKEANLNEAELRIREAARRGAQVVALPEVFNWRGDKNDEPRVAEPIPGPTTERIARLARQLGLQILAGSILEEIAGERRVYNTSALFDSGGNLVATYRKIHLFDVAIGTAVSVLESETRAPGSAPVVAETGLCTVGLTICYDLRFPELYRALVAQGAKLIFVPAAFTALTGEAHWETLVRARAIENQVYVVAPNQFGKPPKSFATYGNSMIVDPWGRVIARASDGPGVICAEIDLDYLARVRTELPALSHRKLF
ncbi:MAG TPA: carbon-nitrogen hydrolase family protein [Candidatus Acidoferrales bacterium]|nr:carbon-nitrogen hydrolase family protein [Candidatus Acidoferrales bacterium]